MLSGALLLNNTQSTKVFLKRRFTKIAFPTLFWTFFYLAITPNDNAPLWQQILSIPFSAQGHGVLWFMYTLAGLYLITPILSRWIQRASKKEIEFYLLLWLITLCYPYLKYSILINDNNTGILYYFSGYLGYFVLGYYLKHFYSLRWWHIVLTIVTVITTPILLLISGVNYDFYEVLWYLSLPVALMAFCWFALISKSSIFSNHESKAITATSRLSFGIYFIHIFLMRSLIWKIDFIQHMSGLVSIFVIAIFTFVASWGIIWLISKLSFSKYIIGL